MGTNRRKAVKDRKKRRVLARKENAKKVAARLLGVRKHKPEIWEWKKSNEEHVKWFCAKHAPTT